MIEYLRRLIIFSLTSTRFHIFGGFNIYHKEWLVHSNKTNAEGKYCRDFSIAYELTQIIREPTQVLDKKGHQVNLLSFILTSCPDKCLSKVLPPLGTSDHSLISVQIDAKLKVSPDVPFHGMIFHYAKVDWDSF